jgi:hypothetical protein
MQVLGQILFIIKVTKDSPPMVSSAKLQTIYFMNFLGHPWFKWKQCFYDDFQVISHNLVGSHHLQGRSSDSTVALNHHDDI